MRNVRFTIYCLLVLLSSCEKEIDMDYHTVAPHYVAEVEVKPGLAKARLTTTRAIENSKVEDTYISNANVTVSMVPDGKSYQLTYKGRGIYETKVAGIEGQEYQEFPQADLGSALNTFNVSYYYDDDEDEPEPTATAAPAPVEDTDEEIVDGGSEDPSIAGDEAA